MTEPSAAFLASIAYDPETGLFTRVRARNSKRNGTIITRTSGARGYLKIQAGREWHYAHRLAILIVHGRWPSATVDHINCDPSDNRIVNLREATFQQNMCNRRSLAGPLLKGVKLCRKRYTAQIRVHGKHIHIGQFDTEEQAHAAYAEAANRLHGEFARLS